MGLTNTRARLRSVKKLAFCSSLCALLIFQGCSRKMNDVTKFGSHKVTVSRYALSNEAYIKEDDDRSTSYHYIGYNLASGKYHVVIENEEVIVNGRVYGQLHEGDTVNITDTGLTVNALDYGETVKYLQTNSEQARP